jgi:hypothetical protein
MLADQLDYVVGVDPHLDEHVLAVVAAATGAVLARQAVEANERGYQAALRFAGDAASQTSDDEVRELLLRLDKRTEARL